MGSWMTATAGFRSISNAASAEVSDATARGSCSSTAAAAAGTLCTGGGARAPCVCGVNAGTLCSRCECGHSVFAV
eukprot:211515-Chlamydomonas_euryale.AAC.2